jgi:hypothetical protein
MNEAEKILKFKVKKPTFKERVSMALDTAKEKTAEVGQWCLEHPQEAIGIATLVATGVYNVVKIGSRHYSIYQTQQLKDRYIYDRSNGHYFKMTKVPTTNQWIEIESRRKAGESLGIVLQDMRLL